MAITFVAGTTTPGSTTGTTGTITAGPLTVSVGDLIVLLGNNQSGSTPTFGFTDNRNSGSYTVKANNTDGSRVNFVAYKVCNNSGSLSTISWTNGPNGASMGWNLMQFTGFVGTATDAGDYTGVLHYGSTGTAVAGTSFNTSQANELVCAFAYDAGTATTWGTAPASPWTNPTLGGNGNTPNQIASSYQVVTTAGTATQLTGTLSVADFWAVTQIGFWDAPPPPPPFPLFGQILM